ncbi:hypothetical protein A1O3_06616 [Capronia epimyces CBS 606.96]|uniref:Uncharacterized protein n=1 Tax=Capronia epimyces CBS 606.96 TaxID=1182542 RepID=W9Y0N2_9EURO|nr:uncharacterized protein A1O3_06616 [Capronia epimyces CBS 606.96]EXJ82801.1 hypothetical protein A1O3_06616 [Capronia epimyces CBS 606.96]
MSSSALPPTIVINTPGAATSSVSAARQTPSAFSSVSADPTPPKARPQKPVLVQSCYLCDEQNPGDFSPTTKYLETCLLCSRYFCPIHKSESWDQVCNINHSSYYHECLERAREELAAQGKDTDTNKRVLAETLINEGIYPSLGEREKAIFTTSPVSDAKIQEIESFRSLDAALAGTSTEPTSQLIEERDVVGADIAV